MAYGEIKRTKTRVLAAAIRDAKRNFTASVSGVGRGAPARRAAVRIEVRRINVGGRSSERKARSAAWEGYSARACLGTKRCGYAKGKTPTRAIKHALAALSSEIK